MPRPPNAIFADVAGAIDLKLKKVVPQCFFVDDIKSDQVEEYMPGSGIGRK